ncbi:unnamed protein product [Closterium sp. NIES-53]
MSPHFHSPSSLTTRGAPSAGPGEHGTDPQPPPPPVSGLRTLGLPSPSPPFSPSPPVSSPPLPPPDPSPAVFPPPLPPLSPPLSHTWPSRRSPRARPLSPVPLDHLRTTLFRSSPPRSSPSLLPSPPESTLTSSLSTPVIDYYRLVFSPLLLPTHVLLCPLSPLLLPQSLSFPLLAALTTPPVLWLLLLPVLWPSGWRAAMDSEMASYRSTGTYVDEVPPPGENVVDGMWIFRVKRPPGSPPVFKARYVAKGFSQREGVDFFQTFAPIPKMTTLRVLLHVAAQRDYELHSLDFSTAFLQGSLYEEVWLRRRSAFTGTFPPGTQWRLRRPVYNLRQTPREWHNTLRSTLSDLGFQPSSADPSLFVGRGSTPFFVLVYVDDLVFATTDRVALADVEHELQKRHTCTNLGELRHYLGLQITRDRAARTITLSQSHMVQQQSVVLTGHCDSSYADDAETHISTQRYCFSLGSGVVSWRSTRSSSVSTSTAEVEIYARAMAAQELRWLTFLLTDLGERPSSAPTLFTENKASILLCREPRLESRVKHINVRYFLLRELQRRGHACFNFVESEANTADIFTKALPPCDHQWCYVQLGLVDTGSRLA